MLTWVARAASGLLVGLLLAGCAATTTSVTMAVEVTALDTLRRYEISYVLRAGDVIEVFVYRHPEFSRKSVVRADGFISLPLLGDVPAAGKLPGELGRELTARFGERIKNPEVTVIVENPPEPMVFVLGEVGAPRALPVRQAGTAAQALAQAGNVTKAGDLFNISVVRLSPTGILEAHTVSIEGYSQPEIYMALHRFALKANDLVVVPESYRGQLVRALTDINAILAPYYQYRIIEEIAF